MPSLTNFIQAEVCFIFCKNQPAGQHFSELWKDILKGSETLTLTDMQCIKASLLLFLIICFIGVVRLVIIDPGFLIFLSQFFFKQLSMYYIFILSKNIVHLQFFYNIFFGGSNQISDPPRGQTNKFLDQIFFHTVVHT